jgi:hypothetical protein
MKYENLSLKVEAIKSQAENSYLEIVQGVNSLQPILFNQREVVRRINAYINNRYTERDDDAIFWNIINHRITHFAKLISPDTKDFYPYGLGELNFWQAWALKKKVREFFRDNAFYKTLNDLSEGLATYGSVIWKRYKEDGKVKIKEVKLDNAYFRQSAESIHGEDFVEFHRLSRKELWDKADVWDNVNEVLDKCKDEEIVIWEYSGSWQDDENDKPEMIHEIGYSFGDDYVKLFNEELTEDIYYDFHLGRYRGCWLRVGVPQRLFKLQERVNQLVNQNAASTEIASLLLLKSANIDLTGNVLEQAVNGQIIPDETLQQIGITNTGLTQFIQEMALINEQADRICLTPEIIQGESSPANTTFRGIAVVNAGAVNAFRNYRQDVFEKIAEILLRDVFPDLVKGWRKDEIIEMAEDDTDIDAYKKALEGKMKIEALLSGVVVDEQVNSQILDTIESEISNVPKAIRPNKDFWNFKWGFKMMPTDESVDKNARNDAYFNALNMAGANPALTQIPLFNQYLEDNGISPFKLTPKQMEQLQQSAGQMPEQKKPDQLLAQAEMI